MIDTAKKVITALSVAVIVLTILLGAAITVSVFVVSSERSDGTAWFYVDGTLYRAVKVENGTVSCPDVPTVAGMVFDGWYSDADYTGQKTTFPALIDGDTAFYARRIPFSEADNDYMSASIAIDGSVVVAEKIKPVHGINNGPVNGIGIFDEPYIDASEYFANMGTPFVRLHDTEYPFGRDGYVDIHCVFPDFSADEKVITNYDFDKTDEYVRSILTAVPDAEIIYRLGESIDHTGSGGYTVVPEDIVKWANICTEVVRHYFNEYGIRYYEIWNEPDQSAMWNGTLEQYYELYRVTAQAIREEFGDQVKIGGPALATSTTETIGAFLKAVDGYPLDFLSVHAYRNDPEQYNSDQYSVFKNMLAEHGYSNALLILDEWNFVSGWDEGSLADSYRIISSNKSGAYIAASLIALQNSAVDAALYYDSQMTGMWCGLYYKPYFDIGNERLSELIEAYMTGGAEALNSFMRGLLEEYKDEPLQPLSGTYAMNAYDRLYSMTSPMQLRVTTSEHGLWAIAVTDISDGTTGMLVSNCADTGKNIVTNISGVDIPNGTVVSGTVWECSADGKPLNATITDGKAVFALGPYSFAYFEIQAEL